jgi:ribosome-binding protein aMBF1 (putative translation factor)
MDKNSEDKCDNVTHPNCVFCRTPVPEPRILKIGEGEFYVCDPCAERFKKNLNKSLDKSRKRRKIKEKRRKRTKTARKSRQNNRK